jgi:hypothetical protein
MALDHGFEFVQSELKLKAHAGFAEDQGIAKVSAVAEVDLEAAFQFLAGLTETDWDDAFVASAVGLLKGSAPKEDEAPAPEAPASE